MKHEPIVSYTVKLPSPSYSLTYRTEFNISLEQVRDLIKDILKKYE